MLTIADGSTLAYDNCMQKYRFKKKAGALQEAYDDPQANRASMPAASSRAPLSDREINDLLSAAGPEEFFGPQQQVQQQALSAPPLRNAAFRSAAGTGEFAVDGLRRDMVRAQSAAGGTRPAERSGHSDGLDPYWENHGGHSMFFYTVEEGKRVLAVSKSGKMEVVEGPARVWRWGKNFRPMQHYTAHPSEFLIVRFRDGEQKHLPGPAHVWFDPRVHQDVAKEEALPIADKEAVIVYAEDLAGDVERRIVHGPATFVPKPGEWLHTFSWHGNVGGRKVPGALEFQKLWLLPDQMYHDVPDVRTSDDAVLTIRLMMFFELIDIETMLATTHDPIGDFLNAATSDVVDFVGRHSFEQFKQNTEKLNDLTTYRQLTGRADDIGYRVNRVVYRGYGAKESLEQMHEKAIESRTRLQLEKATEQQAQELEDLKLERSIGRSQKQRDDERSQVESKLQLAELRHEAELKRNLANRRSTREQERLDAEQGDILDRARDDRQRAHLATLAELGVDLTAYLTQGRADRVIELRGEGSSSPHVHLQSEE